MPLSARFAAVRDESGFTMLAVLGALLAIIGFSAAAFAAANGDQRGARRDQDHKRAYSAAEAGLADYVYQLNQDNTYWSLCNTGAAAGRVNQPWNGSGADPRTKRAISGSDAQYTIELLPVAPAATCDPGNPTGTMINPTTGTFRIRSTGFARGIKRSINTTFRRRSFLDYIYFTDLETLNPVTYRVYTGGRSSTPEDAQGWAGRECSYYRSGRSSKLYSGSVEDGGAKAIYLRCGEINFVSGDETEGPLHTNDQLCVNGSPAFGRDSQDAIEVVQDPGWRSCGGGSPNFKGSYEPGAAYVELPPSNSSLKGIVDAGYTFSGRTKLVLTGTTVTVTESNGTTSIKPLPPNGIIYIQNDPTSTCAFYDPTATKPVAATLGCGDAYVSGVYGKSVTIAAEKDVIVEGDLRHTGDALGGLIANGFVRVDHQVNNLNDTYNGFNQYDWTCSNSASVVRQIDAAILALQYSFIVDNWYCGAHLGDLNVLGAISQKYRGPVGTSAGTGYTKKYEYDERLRYRQPPHFLDPVQSSWRVVRQTEQLPAR